MTPTQREAALRLIDDLEPSASEWDAEVLALLRELAAEPVQKPYCTVYEYDSALGLHQELYPRPWNGMKPTRAIPLYTAPQQRKPLTHMQAVLIWGHRSDRPSTAEIVSFARAVEAAHGIKETP